MGYNYFMKNKVIYVCQTCGAESSRWSGQCNSCKEWNTLIETITDSQDKKSLSKLVQIDKQELCSVASKDIVRIKSNLLEYDRCLGGGMVNGQVILIAGHPGIGKSTLILQVANGFEGDVLYVSGEESVQQVAIRAKRLNTLNKKISISSNSNLDSILQSVDKEGLLIVDSIQAVKTDQINSNIGSVSQISACANLLVSYAKTNNKVVIIIGHITKDGNIAGPKILEHLVDTVLFLEGDSNHFWRVLKVHKNRFGDASEVGIFEMDEKGLKAVIDPSSFINEYNTDKKIGSAITMALEGSRPIALEVQALTVKTSFGYPKRTVSGYSLNRLALLCAVMQKFSRVNLLDQDVYVNLASGLSIKEPALDLAVVASILSSIKDKYYKPKTIFFGEVGLSGEIRKVKAEDKRIKEAKILGFSNIISSQNIKTVEDISKYLL